MEWSRKLKTNTKKEIQRIQKEIKEVQGSNMENRKEELAKLKKNLEEAYRREEIYWSQKARVKWLKEGDKNSSYFHMSVAARRKKNNITTF